MTDPGTIAVRIAAIQGRIAVAAQAAGRSAAEITLVAVSKTHPARLVAAARAAGVVDFGENRVQEADEKIELLAADRARLRWHLIGPLQRNKARRAAALFDLIHTLDSVELATALQRHVEANSLAGQRRLPVLLQVSLAGEAQKSGFVLTNGLADTARLSAWYAAVEAILALPQLEVQGLMTVPPFAADPAAARPFFAQLRALRDDLAQRYPAAQWSQLSMGMSNDFEVAIAEGATLVRVGTAIFGGRG